jgi:membrane-bound lytic murein transglycosylase A
VADWRAPCAAAEGVVDRAGARAFFERWFVPYLAANNTEATGLFTGYFEPELHGARRPSGRYQTPLYRRPDDLVMVTLGLFREDLKGRRIAGRVEDGRLRGPAGSCWRTAASCAWAMRGPTGTSTWPSAASSSPAAR